MRIALPEIMGQINPHFGQSTTFTLIDMVNSEITSVTRISAKGLQHHYDKVAKLLQGYAVDVVIVGSINRKGFDALANHGFLVISGVKGEVSAAAKAYFRGELTSYEHNCSRRDKCCCPA